MQGLWLAIAAAVAVGIAVAAVWSLAARLQRQRREEEVARLLRWERERGPDAPEVRELRLRLWRDLLGLPDPIPWGRYPWGRREQGESPPDR
jgi:hypothetical protein